MMRFPVLVLGVVMAIAGCAGGDEAAGSQTGVGPDALDGQDGGSWSETFADERRALLGTLAERVIVPTYEEFLTATETLVEATAAYEANPSVETRALATAAFATAMNLWQRAEVLQVGPAGSMTSALGGQDLRDEIYSWPSVNACRVDQEVLEQAYVDPTAFAGELTNVRGLDAMEYLLFPPETGNGCKASSSINASGDWAAMVATGELEARRAAYSATLASLLQIQAQGLVQLWTGDGGFSTALGTSGDGSAVYPSAQDGLNAISDAMFYVEKVTKDMKLAMPAGISGCEDETCPAALESQHGQRSAENVEQNIIALQAIFYGTYEPQSALVGFDGLLVEMGAHLLAQEMSERLAVARQAAMNVSSSYAELLEADVQQVVQVHEALKSFTDLMKTEFVALLDLALPTSAAGDND